MGIAVVRSDSIAFKAIQWYGTRAQHWGSYRVVDWLRKVTEADVDAELTVERGGLRWRLNPADYVQRDLFWYGTKDHWDLWHVRRILPADAHIVDVGSNFGYYAIHLAHVLGPRSRSIAFEPLPMNYERLAHNVEINNLGDRIEMLPIALAESKGRAGMGVRRLNSGSAQIKRRGGEVTVELDTLDAVWDRLVERGRRCAFVKIDVEGFEASVLAGAKALIGRDKPMVLIEVDPPRLAECGSQPAELQAFFDRFGYRCFVSRRRKLVPTTLVAAPELVNVLCLSPERHAAEIARWEI